VKKRANTRFSLTAKGDAMRPAVIINVSGAGIASFQDGRRSNSDAVSESSFASSVARRTPPE